jgi:hypothetical protein
MKLFDDGQIDYAFQNSIREDGLLAVHGIVFAPGKAGKYLAM